MIKGACKFYNLQAVLCPAGAQIIICVFSTKLLLLWSTLLMGLSLKSSKDTDQPARHHIGVQAWYQ